MILNENWTDLKFEVFHKLIISDTFNVKNEAQVSLDERREHCIVFVLLISKIWNLSNKVIIKSMAANMIKYI